MSSGPKRSNRPCPSPPAWLGKEASSCSAPPTRATTCSKTSKTAATSSKSLSGSGSRRDIDVSNETAARPAASVHDRRPVRGRAGYGHERERRVRLQPASVDLLLRRTSGGLVADRLRRAL